MGDASTKDLLTKESPGELWLEEGDCLVGGSESQIRAREAVG